MVASQRYRALGRNLESLRIDHLNFKIRPAGDYTRRQLSQAAAYTIFAHGEFEHFLEEWTSAVLDKIQKRGFNAGFSPFLAHLVAYREKIAVPSDTTTNNKWATNCGSAISEHFGVVRKNHGISEKHLCSLFIPIGIDVWSIDPILVSDLNAFSKIRGDHAHQSRKSHLGQQFDPFDRMAKANNIYTLLEPLDQMLQAHIVKA